MSFVVAATGAGSVTSPTGAAVGDVALYITRGNSATTPPTGWTEVADGQANSGNFYSFGWKTLVSADLSGTWAWAGGAQVVSVAVYRGISGSPSFAAETKITTLTAGSVTLPTVGPAASDETVVRLIGIATNFTTGITWTAGATSRTTGSGGGFWSTAAGDNDVASGSSSGTATATFGNGSCDYIYTSVTLTLVTPTALNAASTVSEQALAATTLTLATLLNATSTVSEQTLAAGPLALATLLNAASTTSEQSLAAGALNLYVATSTWVGDDDERWQIPFEWSFAIDIEPVEDPPPATDPYIQRASITMPTPTLSNGRPTQPWTPSIAYSDWGRLQLIIGGHDRSRPRGKPFVPLTDVSTEPFGDGDASFAFPGITGFDDPATFGLVEFAPVRLRRKTPGGVFHTLYEGELASLEPDEGQGVIIHCIGALYRVDLLKEPPELIVTEKDRGYIIARAFNHKRSRYNLRIARMQEVTTGITGVQGGDFSPMVTGAVQDHLSAMTTDTGGQYTVRLARPRTPVLDLKDLTTVTGTVSYGAPGVQVSLSQDFTSATTSVFATGSNGHCSWMGARFPNYRGRDVPAFPLTPGAVFNPGDGQTGFAPFSNLLRAGDFNMQSGDTYISDDVDEVEAFQDRAGITVDGIVGAQTWEAAFAPGENAGSISGAYVGPIYEKTAVRKRLYDQFGSDIGPNPNYDPTVPVVQDYIPFGDNVPKHLGRKSAKQTVNRNYPAGRTGTVTLTSDPVECSRWDLNAGDNIELTNYAGGSVLLHVARRTRDWQAGSVTLAVDEKARDLLTLGAIHQRDRDVSDLTRRERFGRRRSKVFNDYGTWLCEDGAGEYPLENLQAGFWNVQKIAAAPKGSIDRISFAAGTGLTESILNDNLGSTPPSSIPGAARFVAFIFAEPIAANTLANLLPAPLTANANGTNPVDAAQDALDKHGMIYAVGGPGQACGFFPNNDPGDGTSTLLTGRFEDGGGVDFGPTGHYWLWVAVWSPVSCKIGGRIFPGAPA